MIEARDRSECFALGPFAAAGCTKQDERAVFHESDSFIPHSGRIGKGNDYFAATGSMLTRRPPRPRPTFLPGKNFVPRCRTMMLPATTSSLPNRFTPSRLLTLSRPFLTLPCPFL